MSQKKSPKKSHTYGWVPDLPDHRDHLFAAPLPGQALPTKVDLRPLCPPVYDQGQLGSCTANSIGAAFEFDRIKEKIDDFQPSRLFIYYNERSMEGTVNSDAGAQIRDGIKSVAKLGDCPEALWPYVIAKFRMKPPAACYQNAYKHRAVSYQRVARDLNQMKGCLASGYPFVFGFSVFQSFMSPAVAKTGHVPMPAPGEPGAGEGGRPAGHAVMAVGYDDTSQWFFVRNSWGPNWGIKGYFTMPYAYLTQRGLSSDFWTIRIVQ